MYLDPNQSKPIYEQVIFNIKKQILQGILSPGEQIPSVRALAQSLGINPNTIAKAYKDLEAQEVIVTVKGRGSFVNQVPSNDELSLQEEKKIRQEIREWLTEAQYAQIPIETIHKWIDEEVERIKNGN